MFVVLTTTEYDEWVESLGPAEKAEMDRLVRLLKRTGPLMLRPLAATLKGSKHANMKEPRGQTNAAVLRAAYAFDPRRRAILLIGGAKQGVSQRRFHKRLIATADALYDKHLRNLKSGKKGR